MCSNKKRNESILVGKRVNMLWDHLILSFSVVFKQSITLKWYNGRFLYCPNKHGKTRDFPTSKVAHITKTPSCWVSGWNTVQCVSQDDTDIIQHFLHEFVANAFLTEVFTVVYQTYSIQYILSRSGAVAGSGLQPFGLASGQWVTMLRYMLILDLSCCPCMRFGHTVAYHYLLLYMLPAYRKKRCYLLVKTICS